MTPRHHPPRVDPIMAKLIVAIVTLLAIAFFLGFSVGVLLP